MRRFVALDVETAQPFDHVIEIAAVEIIGREITANKFIKRVRPRADMNPFCYRVHRISLEELRSEAYFEQIVPELTKFIGSDPIIAHNYSYEYNTLRREFGRARIAELPRHRYECTMALAKKRGLPSKLREACSAVGIEVNHLGKAHDALNDAILAARLFLRLGK